MRPPSERQSALRAPLNYLLGTEANVRIMRVLAEIESPLGKTDVARRAELNASGVRRAIDDLVDQGFLEALGTGPRQLVRLRQRHPLAPALRSLFEAERNRFEDLIDQLRLAVEQLQPPPYAAWIEGSVAQNADMPGDPLILGILASSQHVDGLADQLSHRLKDVMREHEVLVEVRPRTAADLATASEDYLAELGEAIPILGPPPLSLGEQESSGGAHGRGPDRHTNVDRRMLRLAEAIAARLRRDPSLVERAEKYIDKRLDRASAAERKELLEWKQLLESISLPRLCRFLVDPGERATRLRQTLPFLDVISKDERDRLLQETGP